MSKYARIKWLISAVVLTGFCHASHAQIKLVGLNPHAIPVDKNGAGSVPSAASSGALLLFHGSPRACRSPDPVPSRPYSRCVGRAAFIDASDRGISVK